MSGIRTEMLKWQLKWDQGWVEATADGIKTIEDILIKKWECSQHIWHRLLQHVKGPFPHLEAYLKYGASPTFFKLSILTWCDHQYHSSCHFFPEHFLVTVLDWCVPRVQVLFLKFPLGWCLNIWAPCQQASVLASGPLRLAFTLSHFCIGRAMS